MQVTDETSTPAAETPESPGTGEGDKGGAGDPAGETKPDDGADTDTPVPETGKSDENTGGRRLGAEADKV